MKKREPKAAWYEEEDEMDMGMDMEMDDMKMKDICMSQEPMPMVLAHAYVPWQKYERAFSPKEALMKGTLFPELWGVYKIPV